MRLESTGRPRDIGLLLGAGLVSQTGDWILRTGISFQIYVLTGSTVAAATALLASLGPQVLLGSIAGAYVDRWDRRRVMIIVNLLSAAVLVPLFVVHDHDQVWLIYLVLAASSCLAPFFLAAEATMLPAMITDPQRRVTMNSLNAQVRDVSRLIGAAVGGILAGFGFDVLAGVDMATFIVAGVLLTMIRFRPAAQPRQPTSIVRDLGDGFGRIRTSRPLLVILVFMIVTGVGEAIMGTLFAPFVHDELHAGASVFGTILSAQAAGGIVGGAVITLVGRRLNPRLLFGWGAVLFGLLDLILFLYPLTGESVVVWPAFVLIALVGLPAAAVNAGLVTVLQNATEDRIRGRVFGSVTAAQNAFMLAATGVAGVAAEHFGIIGVLSVQGIGYMAAGLVVVLALRAGRQAHDQDRHLEPAATSV